MIPILYTIGGLILTALTKEAAEATVHWFLDQEVTKYNGHGVLSQKVPQYDAIDPEKQIIWAVSMKTNAGVSPARHIGNIMLDINWIDRKAEFSCIFGKEHWGKGYATKAIRQLFDHGFNKLNLNKIWLGTPETNKAMVKIAENLGMQKEGKLIHDMYLEGHYVNVIRYCIFDLVWNNILTDLNEEVP